MSLFKYKAVNTQGVYAQGRMDAVNEPDLESRLHAMGLELLSYREVSEQRSRWGAPRVRRQDLINFCFHLEQMSRSGVPLIDSLVDLRDSMEHNAFREVVAALVSAIEGGKTFSQGLSEFPHTFDTIFTNLVRAGEQSGELDKVLHNMTDSLKWQDEIAARTKKLVLYPAFVGTVVLAVVFFMMIYLVPQMVNFIRNMGETLPLHTRLLISTSWFFTHYWYLILGTPLVLFFSLRSLAKNRPPVRRVVDRLKLRAWLIGPVLHKIILARFATYFGLLYRSGISILQCLKICEDISGNVVVREALEKIRQQTSDGTTLSESIAQSGLFPPLVLRMIRVGESTGRLDLALENVSYFYNREVKESIDRVQTMIEPILTVVLGVILGWVMLSVLGPIYDIIAKIK